MALTAKEKLVIALIKSSIKSTESTINNQSDPHPGAYERLETLERVLREFIETCGGRTICADCKGKGWRLVATADSGPDLAGACPACNGEGEVYYNG